MFVFVKVARFSSFQSLEILQLFNENETLTETMNHRLPDFELRKKKFAAGKVAQERTFCE